MIETFPNPDPTHGRPRLAALSGPEGELAIHVERESKTLWLFANGPKGGDRGKVIVPVRHAGRLVEWIDAGGDQAFGPGGEGYMVLRDGKLVVSVVGWRRSWQIALSDVDREGFLGILRQWAAAALGQAIGSPAGGESG